MPSLTPLITEFPESIQKYIKTTIEVVQPEQLILFGSRARKTHRGNSDFDIAALGKIDSQKWIQLKVLLSDDSPSLYSVDLVLYESLGDDYKKNIAHEGKLIYG